MEQNPEISKVVALDEAHKVGLKAIPVAVLYILN